MIMQQISPLPQKGEYLAGLKRTSNVEGRLARLFEGFGCTAPLGPCSPPAAADWIWEGEKTLRTWRYQIWDDSRDAEEGNFSGPTTCSIFPVYSRVYLSVVAVIFIHSAKDCGENNGQYRVYTALARGRVSQLEAG
ncbi:predicted protein [Histoplasma capsulatum G186AR]|uniref:Uncharacterized protein n=1 Tax=Ajellomyces capsulatus (strain G186AR / H82 / ATCC MYA-2454 / RMSCC 2432) TaxID=447093 RepID=C0NEG1_AJECG|nr:uncharacterized protein HCBG_01277 [Histoplasma capsulatum G186AR]EEH09632.1 predicted protein [Histoplasma capsulatum G186AR]